MRKEQGSFGVIWQDGSENKHGYIVTHLDARQGDAVDVCAAATTPTGGQIGYAIGCGFTNTATGKKYVNVGTALLSLWEPYRDGARTIIALADAAATPTAAQLVSGSVFTMTPTVPRTFTVPTAALLVAAFQGATVGKSFDFTIVCLAAFAVTVTAAAGVTVVGVAALTNVAGTFRGILTNVTGGAEAVTIYQM